MVVESVICVKFNVLDLMNVLISYVKGFPKVVYEGLYIRYNSLFLKSDL